MSILVDIQVCIKLSEKFEQVGKHPWQREIQVFILQSVFNIIRNLGMFLGVSHFMVILGMDG